MQSRVVHSYLATVAAFPVSLAVLSGMSYRIARNVFHVEKPKVLWLLQIHDMSIIGLQDIYPGFLGILVLALLVTGGSMLGLRQLLCGNRRRCLPQTWTRRSFHRFVGLFVLVPLSISAITGAVWCVCVRWFKQPSFDVSILLIIHQGSYVSSVAYVSVLGSGVLLMVMSGANMLWRPSGAIRAERARAELADFEELDSRPLSTLQPQHVVSSQPLAQQTREHMLLLGDSALDDDVEFDEGDFVGDDLEYDEKHAVKLHKDDLRALGLG